MAITLLQPFNLDTAGNYTFNTLTANIKTDNLMYANGSPYVFSGNPAGSNTQVQFNDANSFGASAAFTFNKSSNVLTISGNLTSTNANLGNLATANFITGTLTTGTQPNITSTGTLSSLTVTGLVIATSTGIKVSNIYDSTNTLTIETKYGNNAGDAGVYGNLTIGTSGTGNITAYNANLGNLVIGNFLQGTLTTAAQPNVTSVGTLSSLSVTANVSSGNANLGNLVVGNFLQGTLTSSAQPNITSVGTLSSLAVTSNVSAGNILTNNLLYANGVAWSFGSTYSNANVAAYLPTYTGNLTAGNANLGNLVTGNFVQGTLITGLQPNITSVGTLSSLTVTSNISSGNANLGNLVIGNFVQGTLTTGLQPNITSTGTLSNLTVSGNVSLTGSNVFISNISNFRIPGGTANFVMTTDGTGNLRWAAAAGGGGGGTPGGANTQLQFNNNGNFAGTSGLTFISDSNRLSITNYSLVTNVLGNVSGNVTVNLNLGSYVTATVTGTVTWTFSNSAPSSNASGFILELTNGGSNAQIWPTSVKWPSGVAPVLTGTGVDVLAFVTDDAGTNWRGVASMIDSK